MTLLADELLEQTELEENTTKLPNFVKVTILGSVVEDNKLCNSYNRRYNCKISNPTTNESFTITFHDSVYNWKHNIKLNKADVVYSALMDSMAYESSRTMQDFAENYGYDYEKAFRPFTACERTYKNFHRVFNTEEIEILDDIFQNY